MLIKRAAGVVINGNLVVIVPELRLLLLLLCYGTTTSTRWNVLEVELRVEVVVVLIVLTVGEEKWLRVLRQRVVDRLGYQTNYTHHWADFNNFWSLPKERRCLELVWDLAFVVRLARWAIQRLLLLLFLKFLLIRDVSFLRLHEEVRSTCPSRSQDTCKCFAVECRSIVASRMRESTSSIVNRLFGNGSLPEQRDSLIYSLWHSYNSIHHQIAAIRRKLDAASIKRVIVRILLLLLGKLLKLWCHSLTLPLWDLR